MPWLKTSKILEPVKRRKFALERDYDSGDEDVQKEQKRCWNDVRLAIQRFVKEDPHELV